MELEQLGFEPEIIEKIKTWLSEDFDSQTREEIRSLILQGDRGALLDMFYTDLDFGTGGMRGKVGAGTNRMNKYTVGMATQGLAHYILQEITTPGDRKAVIAYDSRNGSPEFARQCAQVLAANGIKTYVFESLRPTPELSFAVRLLGACSGIVITASHNPKEYNGYKVYWSDGAQIVPPHDENIIGEVKSISSPHDVKTTDYDHAVEEGLVEEIGESVDEEYLKAIHKDAVTPDIDSAEGGGVSIFYTPLHGSGIALVPRALEWWGFTDVHVSEEQKEPDGDFPSVESPNPEDSEALLPAIKGARKVGSDILLANDPDGDRLGMCVRQPDGDYHFMNGNQCASLLCWFILSQLKEQGRLPHRPAVVTTIVTTRMIEKIASSLDTHTAYTLTGFKWICERERLWEQMPPGSPDKYDFVFGTEESLGYVVGTRVRDKDGVIAACVASEMALWIKTRKKMTLLQFLDELYREYGVFTEKTKSIYLRGAQGEKQMLSIMDSLRDDPPKKIAGAEVQFISDIYRNQRIDCRSGEKVGEAGLPKSNVLIFEIERGHRVIARPSGTEPKIKFYFLLQDTDDIPIKSDAELTERKKKLQDKLELIIDDFIGRVNLLIPDE